MSGFRWWSHAALGAAWNVFRVARTAVVVAAVFGSLGAAGEEDTPPHPEVLVVVNGESGISTAIGEYYRASRKIPPSNVVRLSIPIEDHTLSNAAHEVVSRAVFIEKIRDPIEEFLAKNGLEEKIEIIVTTKGVPLRVEDESNQYVADPLRDARDAAVDAELALLFSRLDGTPGVASTLNPYFDAAESFAAFRHRRPRAPLRYLTARLTGYQDAPGSENAVPRDVKRLVDAARGRQVGRIYLIDENPNQPAGWIQANRLFLSPAAEALKSLGLTVFHDRIAAFRFDVLLIGGYASWGSNDENNAGVPYYGEIGGRRYPGTFTSRAISVDIVSTNARSFVYPPRYGQSLVADLIRSGAAGAAGHVEEPMLNGVARPHILLREYALGAPAVEAYFRSIPYLGWMNVYIGDPLMRLDGPAPRIPSDLDRDGVPSERDNCSEIPNPDQRDTNGDGYGNACDADFDGDGMVTTSWGAPPYGDLERIESTIDNGSYDADQDLDGDGKVDAKDHAWASATVFLPPGPSGLAP